LHLRRLDCKRAAYARIWIAADTRHTSPQLRQSGRRTAWPVACAATISCWRPASNSFPSARVNPKLAISPRSSGRLVFKTSAHCLSPSAPVFTNLTIQATRLPPIRDQTPNYRFGARTPNLQAVPTSSLYPLQLRKLNPPASLRRSVRAHNLEADRLPLSSGACENGQTET